MPDLTDLLRQSASAEAAAYEPSAALPQRIARRTLQLQRRRRARMVGAAFGLLALALPLIVYPSRHRSNAVNIAYGPTPVTAKEAKATTTTTTVPVRLLDLQAFIDNGVKERNEALRKLAVLKRQRARDNASRRDDAEVLGATAERDPSPKQDGPSNGSTTTSRGSTTTTGASTTTTTKSTTTTTTTTSPPPVYVPLAVVAPGHVCAGVPAVFRATGTGADLVVWSNLVVGATATYVLTESTTVVARLDLNGSISSQAVSVQVIPTGTPPC